jgi:hypothetical protein
MYAMQYELPLPADYDMGTIRERVRVNGHRLDAFAGLGLKAYLIREGSPGNLYAPFYLWQNVDSMGKFLWGGAGFERIIASFGRPRVRHWTGVAFAPGPELPAVPRSATRDIRPLPPGGDLAAEVSAAVASLRAEADRPEVHSAALGIDPYHWEIVHFTLWRTESPASEPGDRFEVLHLSTPDLAHLAA